MGRAKFEWSVLHQAYKEAIKRGSDKDSAFQQAWAARDIAIEQRKARRRETKRESARLRRHLMSGGHSSHGRVLPKKKPITIWLEESEAAILNAEAQRLAGTSFTKKDGFIEFWRSAVISRLLCSLDSDNQKHEIRQEEIQGSVQGAIQEETIAALQDIIANERKRGIPDADIQREVDKSHLNMTLDEVMNYHFKTVNWNPRLSSTQPLP